MLRPPDSLVGIGNKASAHTVFWSHDWLDGAAWVGLLTLDSALVIIGIWTYYFNPLPGPYPFIWAFELVGVKPSTFQTGVMTYLAVGVTPVAALLLLFHSLWRLALSGLPHPNVRLFSGVFCAAVGLSFLATILVYVLRAPDVLDWGKESVASMVHALIAARGLWLVSGVRHVTRRNASVMAWILSFLWLIGVAVPQHPWLVVWMNSFQDFIRGL